MFSKSLLAFYNLICFDNYIPTKANIFWFEEITAAEDTQFQYKIIVLKLIESRKVRCISGSWKLLLDT